MLKQASTALSQLCLFIITSSLHTVCCLIPNECNYTSTNVSIEKFCIKQLLYKWICVKVVLHENFLHEISLDKSKVNDDSAYHLPSLSQLSWPIQECKHEDRKEVRNQPAGHIKTQTFSHWQAPSCMTIKLVELKTSLPYSNKCTVTFQQWCIYSNYCCRYHKACNKRMAWGCGKQHNLLLVSKGTCQAVHHKEWLRALIPLPI